MEFTHQQLLALVQQKESEALEFKKSTGQLKRACETACAFLNGNGGHILIGVADNGQLIGQEIRDKTKREIGNELAKITPVPDIEITHLILPNTDKGVFIIHVTTDSTKKPYLYENRAYIRIQTDTLPMPREYLQQLTLNNAQSSYQWEDQVLAQLTLDDIDVREILITVNEGIQNGRIPEASSTTEPWLALQHLGLIKENKLTSAAIVLFGKHPEQVFPQCILKMARFKGLDKGEFLDNKQVHGNVFELMRAAITFAQIHLPVASHFPKNSLEREDKPFFPFVALREALANAICHRDYTSRSSSISFAIYDDRIEIWSYGLLPAGVDFEDLTRMNQSVPRNHRIANILYYHKLFESWGRGIQLIMKECTQANHPTPFYTINTGGLLLTMPFKTLLSGASITESDSNQEHTQLTQRQQEILHLLIKNPQGLSTRELHERLEDVTSERWVREDLKRLKAQGLIDATGQTSTRKWFVLNK